MSFHSRPAHTTTISWYKNGYHIFNATNTTTVLGALEGSTSLLLLPPLIRREDGGVYTVVITNSFSEIPIDMRNSSISFELKVKGKSGGRCANDNTIGAEHYVAMKKKIQAFFIYLMCQVCTCMHDAFVPQSHRSLLWTSEFPLQTRLLPLSRGACTLDSRTKMPPLLPW